jgi:hypothetical protein
MSLQPTEITSNQAATKAKLGDVHLMADQTIEWTLRPGVSPYQTSITVRKEDAEKWGPKVRLSPLQLSILAPKAVPNPVELTVNGVWITDILPGPSPYLRSISLSDLRWRWEKHHVIRGYNIQRRSGAKRLVSLSRLEEIATSDDLIYADWSLNGGKVWTALEILQDITASAGFGEVFKFMDGTEELMALDVANLEIDDSFGGAITRVLGFIPGLNVIVNAAGEVIFYSEFMPAGVPVSEATDVVVGAGQIIRSDLRNHRTKKARVLINREVEVRFDSVEGSLTPAGAGYMHNVLPSPDASLTVSGYSQPVVAGTWLKVSDALAAWRQTAPPTGLPALTEEVLREHWFQGLDMYALVGANDDPDNSPWPARIAALKRHYRQTYRIQRSWMDRIVSLRANRLSMMDEGTGHYGAASVWTNYCITYQDRTKSPLKGDQTRAVNVTGYAAELDEARAAPMTVRVLDAEVGVIRVELGEDPKGVIEQFVPCNVDDPCTGDMSGENGARWWYEPALFNRKHPVLAEDHGIAIILTVAEGSPNSNERMQELIVYPQESAYLPADGDEVDIRIGAGVVTAKFAWVDNSEQASLIRQLFGFERVIETGAGSSAGGPSPFPGSATYGSSISEKMQFLWINFDECEEVAEAAIQAYNANYVDRLTGSHTVYMMPGRDINGTIAAVQHSLTPSGDLLTTISMSDTLGPSRDIWSFMSSSLRRKLLRMVQP